MTTRRVHSLLSRASAPRRPALLLVVALVCVIGDGVRAADSGAALVERKATWFAGPEAATLLANLLTYQTPEGGWGKAYDVQRPRDAAAGRDGYGSWDGTATIDNGATVGEIRALCLGFAATQRITLRDAARRGLIFLLDRQLANGGWPQRFPTAGRDVGYGAAITFNDHAMVGVLRLLRDAGLPDTPVAAVIDDDLRRRASDAVTRGMTCILACQVVTDGRLTVWCQQHDAVTLAPTKARAYELPSLCGSESAGIVRFLMELEQPDARIRQAIEAAVAWFGVSEVLGKRLDKRVDPTVKGGEDRVLVDDPSARGLWVRFYDLGTNRPFFCNRDGIKRWDFAELDAERRNGYAWFGTWGIAVAKDHARWRTDAKRGGAPTP